MHGNVGNKYTKLPSGYWARLFDRCVLCGSKVNEHAYKGHCKKCYAIFRKLMLDVLLVNCERYYLSNHEYLNSYRLKIANKNTNPFSPIKRKKLDKLTSALHAIEREFRYGKTTEANRKKFHGILLDIKQFCNGEGDYSSHSGCCLQCRAQYHKDGILVSKTAKRTS